MADVYIGNYRVIKKIGAGGQARVYLAVHKDVPNLRVILKILSDATLADRFKQEADKLALLDGHSSICRIKHFFNEGDDLVIAMEYIHGETLDQLIADAGQLPPREILTIVKKLLSVLEFAHQREIYHRDIKPSNIMITKEGEVKVIDFGIAKSKSDPNLTQAGAACGTPAYMAPEQFTPTEDTDYARVDVYAVGVTMYFALTGKLPFKADNEFLMRDLKLSTDPPPLREHKTSIPSEIERIVLKALARDAEDRYTSAAEMRQAVEVALKQNQPAPQDTPTESVAIASSVSTATPEPPKPPSSPGSKKFLYGAIAVLALVAVAVIWWATGGGDEQPIITPPTPVSPADGTVFSDTRQPTLVWQPETEGVSTVLEFATAPDFSDRRTRPIMTDTTFTFQAPLDNGTWYWRLWAQRESGPVGPSSARSFRIAVARQEQPEPLPTGTLVLDISPSADRVTINDSLTFDDQSDFEMDLPEGVYVVAVANQESRQKLFIDTVSLSGGGTLRKNYRFTFPDDDPDTPVTLGEIRVGSTPRGAEIWINEKLQRQKTNFAFRLPPGSHRIRATIELNGETKELTRTVTLESDQVQRLSFDFEEEKAYLNP